jgi:hypothetical protein
MGNASSIYPWERGWAHPVSSRCEFQLGQPMTRSLIDVVALALLASDGMKYASSGTSLEQSWERMPERHVEYRERAIVFVKVMGQQMVSLADAEIAGLDEARGR